MAVMGRKHIIPILDVAASVVNDQSIKLKVDFFLLTPLTKLVTKLIFCPKVQSIVVDLIY